MRVLVIPDIHGSIHWKKNFVENIDKVDKCVFLGDYVDSFNENEKGEAAAKNFEDIIHTTEPYKNKVHLLLGNHDASYIYQYYGSPQVSGHQSAMTERYNDMFIQNKDRLQVAVKIDNWVFSHAGFSKTWYKNMKTNYDTFFKNKKKIPSGPIRFANWMWETDNDIRPLNFSDYSYDLSGDDRCQGPLWIRPNSLLQDAYYPNQVVGHTEVRNKEHKPVFIKYEKINLIIVDSPEHNTYLILDTENVENTEKDCIAGKVRQN